MDIFKFHNPEYPTRMLQGEIINNVKSKLWVERYDKAGEFKIVANVGSRMKELLPIGSFISHTDTAQIMMVEDHEITSDEIEDEITITGRSYEAFLSHRVLGNIKPWTVSNPNSYWDDATETSDFQDADAPAEQLRKIIYRYISGNIPPFYNLDNVLPFVQVFNEVSTSVIAEGRYYNTGNLYEEVLKSLKAYGYGLKSIRPGKWTTPTPPVAELVGDWFAPGEDAKFVIHKGVDRKDTVIFSKPAGEIERADYLWSERTAKNYALVKSKWMNVVVDLSATQMPGPWEVPPEERNTRYYKRMTTVDASNIDSKYQEAPTGSERTKIINTMKEMGRQAIKNSNTISITKAEVPKQGTRWKYRVDYDIGDLVTVLGDYEASAVKRVVEHVEIEDSTGRSAYPTFDVV